jgi:hypothetical protein
LEELPDVNKAEQCFWCGKNQISGFWSGNQRKYCSFRCAAAGEHRNVLFIMIASTPFTFLCLMFPDSVYSYLDAGNSSSSSPSLFALIAVNGIILVLVSITSFSLYASYIGWSVRKTANDTSAVNTDDDYESKREPLIFCSICGSPEVSTFWSNSKGYFCSFKCSAARDYIQFLGMAITTLTLLLILIILESIRSIQQPLSGSILIIAISITIMVLLDMGFFYAAYIGWRMHHEIQLDTYNEEFEYRRE